MRIEANNLKVGNIILVVLCGLIVPISRVLDHHAASAAGTAAWLTPFAAAILFVPYALILSMLIKKHPDTSLSEINTKVLGKYLGTAVNMAYVAWFIILSAYYLSKFGERMSTTVFYNTDGAVFIAVILVLLSVSCKLGQEPLIRACCIFFFAVCAVFVFALICVMPNMHAEYHLPVTPSLLPGVLKGGVQIFSVLTYFVTLPFFFGEMKSDGVKKGLFAGGAVALLLSLFSIFVIVGVFSAPLAAGMPFPFFSATKEIVLFESVERIEAIIICVMILSDFTLISLFVTCCGRVAKGSFGLKTPFKFDLLLLLIFGVSLFFSLNSTRLNEISALLIVPLNLIVGAGFPMSVSGVCLIRSVISRKKLRLSHA